MTRLFAGCGRNNGQERIKLNPEKIILFESYAYGKPKTESDVDLLVVMGTPLRNSEQAALSVRAIDYHFGMDSLVRRPQQLAEHVALGDSFLREITERGKVVYARTTTSRENTPSSFAPQN